MDAEKIFKLIDLGFTRDDILKLIDGATVGGPDSEPEPEPDREPEPEPAQPAQPDAAAAISAVLEKFSNSFNDMIKDMQAANMHAARQHEPEELKPEDILASIIYPPQKEGKK